MDSTATWTSTHEGSLLFICKIFEADRVYFNKNSSKEAGSITKNVIKILYH